MKKAKFKLQFFKNYRFLWLPQFWKTKLRWKDKFETPRCEMEPSFKLEWLWFGIYGSWGDDEYWEQWLWFKYYSNENYEAAKETWPWIDSETRKSSWIDY